MRCFLSIPEGFLRIRSRALILKQRHEGRDSGSHKTRRGGGAATVTPAGQSAGKGSRRFAHGFPKRGRMCRVVPCGCDADHEVLRTAGGEVGGLAGVSFFRRSAVCLAASLLGR